MIYNIDTLTLRVIETALSHCRQGEIDLNQELSDYEDKDSTQFFVGANYDTTKNLLIRQTD